MSFKADIINILALLIISIGPSNAQALPLQCKSLLSKHNPNISQSAFKAPIYTYEIPHLKIRNQGCYYSCWAVTSTTYSELAHFKTEPLAHDYMFKNFLQARVREALEDKNITTFKWLNYGYSSASNNFVIRETGEFWKGVLLTRELGALREADWNANPSQDKDRRSLVNLTEKLMNDFFDKEKKIKNDTARTHLVDKTYEEINKNIDLLFGQQKTEAKTIPGDKFYSKYNKVVRYVAKNAWPSRDEDYKLKGKETLTILKNGKLTDVSINTATKILKIEKVLDVIKNNFSSKTPEPMFLSFNIPMEGEAKVDYTTGEMDVDSFIKEPFRDVVRHAVILTGVKLDKNGRVSGLKIVNSYGPEVGDKGAFHMSRAFIESYLFEVLAVE